MPHQPKAPAGCYWRGKTLYGRFVAAGVEYRFSLETDDPGTALARLKAEKDRVRAASKWGDDRKRFAEVLEAWAGALGDHISTNTAKRYLSSLDTLSPHLEGFFVDEIDKKKVAEIIAKRRAAGVKTATINRDLTALSSVLEYAEDQGWREGNPAREAQGSKRQDEKRIPITLPAPQDIERVVALAPGNLVHLIRAALLTGCRQDELVRLEWRAIDLRRRQMEVVGKRKKLRMVPLTPEAAALFQAIPRHLKKPLVFWHGAGLPYANVASRFRELTGRAAKAARKKEAEFRRFRFHDLRHLFAVEYLRDGRGSIYRLQRVLGHTSVKTTEVYLAHLTPEQAQRAQDMDAAAG